MLASSQSRNKSLFIHFQGHPEYAAETLLKEYRRDIKRFVRRERETYPSLPHGYFSASAVELLTDFRGERFPIEESTLATFQDAVVAETLQHGGTERAREFIGIGCNMWPRKESELTVFGDGAFVRTGSRKTPPRAIGTSAFGANSRNS